MKCVRCGETVERGETAWREVKGWTAPRQQGGANSISLRKQTGRVMHTACMALEKSTIHPGQTDIEEHIAAAEAFHAEGESY